MARALPEWIGKTSNTTVPPRVRLRNLAASGNTCGISGLTIRAGDAWQTDHKVALIAGGENRESNLHPVLTKYHRLKTAREITEKAQVARSSKAVMGVKAKKPLIRSPGFPEKTLARIPRQTLPPRQIYEEMQ